MSTPTIFKLILYTPPAYLEPVKAALFAAGAGVHKSPKTNSEYTHVCFTSPGVGQFRPSDNSKPVVGAPGQVQDVGEVRVETMCVGAEVVRKAVEGMKRVHPYEMPVYEVFKMEDF